MNTIFTIIEAINVRFQSYLEQLEYFAECSSKFDFNFTVWPVKWRDFSWFSSQPRTTVDPIWPTMLN